jgi:predicted RNase H-like HicB family nuclease
MQQVELVVERHSDGYVAYPLGVNGVVVGQGDTYDEALADVKSALAFHIETFGAGVISQTRREGAACSTCSQTTILKFASR